MDNSEKEKPETKTNLKRKDQEKGIYKKETNEQRQFSKISMWERTILMTLPKRKKLKMDKYEKGQFEK